MATLTIRNLEDDVRDKLRIRAAYHGRSMEDEVRVILRGVVSQGSAREIWERSRDLFSGDDGTVLSLPDRENDRANPDFS